MKKIIFLILVAVASFSAAADMVAEGADKSKLTLTQKKCTSKAVINQLREEFQNKFKAAVLSAEGKKYPGCWIKHGDDAFYILMNGGEEFMVPADQFKQSAGV